MPVNKQLQIVADWEQRKEQKMATDYQLAQQNVIDNQNKLTGLQEVLVNTSHLSAKLMLPASNKQSKSVMH